MEEVKENKSVVTSYRLGQDTKDKLKKQLDDMGLTQEQYFSKVVSTMELENAKQNSFLSKDTTIIQSNLDAILNAFISIADSSNNLITNKDTELQELKAKYKEMLFNKDNSITQQIEKLQQVYDSLDILQNENKKYESQLINIKLEYDKQLEQMESNLADKTSLIQEYKQKNDDLITIVSEYKGFKAENETVKGLLADAQTKNISLSNDIKNKEIIINNLNINIEKLNQDSSKQLESLKKELLFDKDKSILELKQEHQNFIEELNNKHNVEIQNYQDKFKNLLEQLETSKQNNSHKRNEKVKQETGVQGSLL